MEVGSTEPPLDPPLVHYFHLVETGTYSYLFIFSYLCVKVFLPNQQFFSHTQSDIREGMGCPKQIHIIHTYEKDIPKLSNIEKQCFYLKKTSLSVVLYWHLSDANYTFRENFQLEVTSLFYESKVDPLWDRILKARNSTYVANSFVDQTLLILYLG